MPEAQLDPVLQGWPAPRRHLFFEQVFPAGQWLSTVHSTQPLGEQCGIGLEQPLQPLQCSSVPVVTQDVPHIVVFDGQLQGPLPEHVCPPVQAMGPPPMQVPPLHFPATLAVELFAHPVEPQEVELPGNMQPALVPSHEPAQGAVPPHGMRAVLTFEHVPVEHDWH